MLGARSIQRFEGSRPWGGDYAYSFMLGLGEMLGEQLLERQERGEDWFGRVCVWWERDFGSRLGTDSWFGGKQGAPRLRVVRGTK